MTPITEILSDDEIAHLRQAFDGKALIEANVVAMEAAYAPLKAWGEATSAVFYGDEPLAPRERELCLIVLLSVNAPEISLADHIYWALMEGATPAAICQALSLAGCYAGMPAMTRGMMTAVKVFTVLKRVAAAPNRGADHVFAELMRALTTHSAAEPR